MQVVLEHVGRDGDGLVHQPPRWPRDLVCTIAAVVQGVVYRKLRSPAQFLRPLCRKAISGGDAEGVRESLRSTGGEGQHQGRDDDGSYV